MESQKNSGFLMHFIRCIKGLGYQEARLANICSCVAGSKVACPGFTKRDIGLDKVARARLTHEHTSIRLTPGRKDLHICIPPTIHTAGMTSMYYCQKYNDVPTAKPKLNQEASN